MVLQKDKVPAASSPMILSASERPISSKRRMLLSVRFTLRSPKKGQTYANPHPLQVWITVGGKRIHFGAVWSGKRLLVNPLDWRVEKQASARRGDPLNQQITQLKAYIETIHQRQIQAGAIPTIESVYFECLNGVAPEWSDQYDWVYPSDKKKRTEPGQYANCISAQSPLDEAYSAYMMHLRQLDGTHQALSEITHGRWKRGLFLLHEFSAKTRQPLPKAGEVTWGWAKRYHAWLQTQDGGRHRPQPVSAGQATRFVLKVSNVLRWMIEEGWINDNPIAKVRWPKPADKEVQFLEPEHVHLLLNLEWEKTKGIALWWFCLMCCTGLDYPDAVAYACNRKTFEIEGRSGWKIVGRRKKPPHTEYCLPLLDEVNQLFERFPQGPADLTAQCVNRYTDLIEAELGIDWRITNKTARKTFGCLMLAAGHRIADVSLMLGHANIMTTERHYVKVRSASIDRSMERVQVNIAQLAGAGNIEQI